MSHIIIFVLTEKIWTATSCSCGPFSKLLSAMYGSICNTVEPAMSSHSYEQPTSYGRPLGKSPK